MLQCGSIKDFKVAGDKNDNRNEFANCKQDKKNYQQKRKCCKALKEILYKALDDFEELPVVDAVTVSKHFDECDTVFFAMCQAELDKINNFFAEKLAESKRKFAALKDECDRHFLAKRRAPIASLYLNSPAAVVDNESAQDVSVYRTAEGTPEHTHSPVHRISDMDMLRRRRNTFRLKKEEKRFNHPSRQVGQNEETPRLKTYDLKLALSEFYLSLVLLQNYQSLNFTGFRKILKKHDKLFQRSNGLEWYRDTVSEEPFHIDDSVDAMIAEVEETFTKLEGGNRQKAMKRLRVPPLSAQRVFYNSPRRVRRADEIMYDKLVPRSGVAQLSLSLS
eukprot:TsM_000698900 transcript=TsM_000698900 gene=TsM_000698900